MGVCKPCAPEAECVDPEFVSSAPTNGGSLDVGQAGFPAVELTYDIPVTVVDADVQFDEVANDETLCALADVVVAVSPFTITGSGTNAVTITADNTFVTPKRFRYTVIARDPSNPACFVTTTGCFFLINGT